ncbi:hypothetical protein Kpol_1039p10 [Vanderwaltozyma polyspora DSM 70294]|uniref:Fork-head domain-containing protein n=1 Tax=Vanderwaltozyma polyspora (strain ATCC 22028 / DSM 70294 / BCRC 21397 / CBS 2163 / NBRC 10782 / NRRL Y-8283 / UCD 57-17) TaxID=436907 RepID=A7THD7_VANPO|nr:uncharacterized protein Kpol_1039p10 [Vanderwaltozyma polyspora DSM 70294]EDO18261.1 hypothetical protein Kpol_1039p10 [Vanderwaltozyma polyspora DSM 70294]
MNNNNKNSNNNNTNPNDQDSINLNRNRYNNDSILDLNSYNQQQHQYLINSIISTLEAPEQFTNVSKFYSNDKNVAGEVQAYAKISGTNWTYYVKDLEITIGRNTSDHNGGPEVMPNHSNDNNSVNIDLGPAKVVSRKHAMIKFNMQLGGWELYLFGRNGAKINFKRVTVNNSPIQLASGTILDIGGTQMMFILPGQDSLILSSVVSHLLPQLSLLYDNSNSSSGKLLNDLIKNSDYYKQNTNNIQNVIKQNETYQNSISSNQVRTFKMYGNNPSSASSSISNPASFYSNSNSHNPSLSNGSSNSSNPLLMLSPDSSSNNTAQQHNQPSYPTSYSSTSNHNNQTFPSPIDFASDLSRDENRNVKPPHSYATMITQAILSTKEGIISLADIYKYISTNYAYYRFAKTGWQNSIRHNLSLNKAFEKVPRKPDEPGKGMKWRISESYTQDFMNKWNSGKVSKIRRGSSVARQLQLHMSKYSKLPSPNDPAVDQPSNYNHISSKKNTGSNNGYVYSNLNPSQQQYQQPNPTTRLQAQPTVDLQRHHQHSQNQSSSSSASSVPDGFPNTLLLPPQPATSVGSSHNPTNSALVSFNNASNPSITRTPQLPSLSNHISTNSTSSLLPPSTSTSNPNHPSFSVSMNHLSPSGSNLMQSPSKTFHVTPMEAYTPERGSTNHLRSPSQNTLSGGQSLGTLGNGILSNSKINNSINMLGNDKNLLSTSILNPPTSAKSSNDRSSPNVWNLLQFNSATNTPASSMKRRISSENEANDNENHNNDGKGDVSPSKAARQLPTKELILETDGAKISMVNE